MSRKRERIHPADNAIASLDIASITDLLDAVFGSPPGKDAHCPRILVRMPSQADKILTGAITGNLQTLAGARENGGIAFVAITDPLKAHFHCVPAVSLADKAPGELPLANATLDLGNGERIDLWRISGDGIRLGPLELIQNALKPPAHFYIGDVAGHVPLPGFGKIRLIAARDEVDAMTATEAVRIFGGEPDRQVVQRFLSLLDPDAASFCFQTFTDNKAARETIAAEYKAAVAAAKARGEDPKKIRRHDPLARIIHGSLRKCWDDLCDLSRRGAGIYVTVQETNGRGRLKADIVRVRAFAVDLDGAPLESVSRCELKPNIITETSPGRFQAFWLVDPWALPPADDAGRAEAVMHAESIGRAIAKRFGGDPQVFDISHVFRLPGFDHQKGAPFRARIVQINDDAPIYTAAEITRTFPPVEKAETEAGKTVINRSTSSREPRHDLGPHAVKIIQALNGDISTGLCCCPAHDDHNPSLYVSTAEDGKTLVFCRSHCEQASVIAALKKQGLWSGAAGRQLTPAEAEDARERSVEEHQTKLRHALCILRHASPFHEPEPTARGLSRVERQQQVHDRREEAERRIGQYRKGRGLTHIPPAATLLPADAARQLELPYASPAMVLPIITLAPPDNPERFKHPEEPRLIGAHLTFFTDDCTGNLKDARGRSIRSTYGGTKGGFIPLNLWDEYRTDRPLVIGEGVESVISAMAITRLPGVAMISATNKIVALPPSSEVFIAADADEAGLIAARRWAKALAAQGRKCRIVPAPALPGRRKTDWNDIIMEPSHG